MTDYEHYEECQKADPKPPPIDQEILATVLAQPGKAWELVEDVGDRYFTGQYKQLYRAMAGLVEDGLVIDDISLAQRVAKDGGNPSIVIDLSKAADGIVAGALNLPAHLSELKRKWKARQITRIGQEMIARADDPTCDPDTIAAESEDAISQLEIESADDPITESGDAVRECFAKIQALYDHGGGVTGVPSGITTLDQLTTGFQPGQAIILAARPGVGKTAMALNFFTHAASHGFPGLYFSQEMMVVELMMRIITARARVDFSKIRMGKLNDRDWSDLTSAAEAISKLPLVICDKDVGLAEIRYHTRRMIRKRGVKFVVLDYLQLMAGSGENRERVIAEISRGVKQMAKHFGIPFLILSQLNRAVESRADKRPQLSDLRESGSIEQDADMVLFIYRPEKHGEKDRPKGYTELDLKKHRSGPTGVIEQRFREEYTSFESPDWRDQEQR